MQKYLLAILTIVLCFSLFPIQTSKVNADNSELPAFPGAEGFGYATTGGRGGEVYHVDSYELTGPGTLHDALTTAGDTPRTIVFDISGDITIPKIVVKNKSDITIAGQTAPGDGVTIRGQTIRFVDSDNIIIRFLRFRMGAHDDFSDDAMYLEDTQNVIIDHSSFSWGTDEVLSIKSKDYDNPKSKNITVQWSVMSEGLLTHSMGGLIEMNTISMHHNLYAHNNDRNPKTKGQIDFVNNIVYNWGDYPYVAGGVSGTKGYGNVVGNYFIAGVNSKNPEYAIVRGNDNYNLFLENNRIDSNKNGILDGTDTGTDMIEKERPSVVVDERFNYPLVHTQDPEEAYDYVLDHAGASIVRDAVDERTIDSVRDQTGAIIQHEDDVGGYPDLERGTPLLDSDGDGIPDVWEIEHGLDPFDPDDANEDMYGEGYTNLEYYLNELAEESYPPGYSMTPPEWSGPPFTPPTPPTTDPEEEPSESMDGDILRNVIVNDNSGNGIENAKKWSVETDLQIGDLVASDRTTGSKAYKFTDIPEELLGSEWIRTPVESRSATNDDVVSYYLSSDADVYVAYDARINTEPEWLTENYEETDDVIVDDQPVNFKLYKKHYPAGSFVEMGPNNAKTTMNYFVIVKPTNSKEAPSDPEELDAEITSDDLVELEWSTVDSADGYLIYRSSTVDDNFKVIASSFDDNYKDETTELGITYNYKVSAINAGGESGKTKSVEIYSDDSTKPAPSEPSDLHVPTVKSIFTELEWEPVEESIFYNVYRATESDGNYEKIASSVHENYTDDTVEPSTTYYYKITANGVGGESEKSDSKKVTTKSAVDIPNTPTGLISNEVTGAAFEIEWDSVTDAEEYNIYKKGDQDNSFSLIDTTSSTNYIDRSIDTSDTGFTYKVSAVNEMGESEQSEELYIETLAPSTPENLIAGLAGASFVGLIWDPVDGASKFNIYRKADGEVENVGTAKVNTFYDRTVEPGVEYTYYIKAENEVGGSDKSNSVTITPDIVSAESIKTLVGQFEDAGDFKESDIVRILDHHLIALDLYEKQENSDKVVKHTQSFNELLKSLNDKNELSNHAYNILKHYGKSLEEKWR